MKDFPISVVIPCLNEEKYLPKLLEDLSKQSFQNFEVIVVDGNSDDQTIAKAQEFMSRLNLTILNSNQRNVAFQRNMGAKKAKGYWFIFMDADNALNSDFLEILELKLRKTSAEGFTCFMTPDSNDIQDKAVAQVTNFAILASCLVDSPFCYGALLGATKDTFKQIGGFDSTLSVSEDWDFAKRVVDAHLVFKCFQEPQFICSFRRIRTHGRLKTIQTAAAIQLQKISTFLVTHEVEYPMLGGTYYDLDRKKEYSTLTLKVKTKFKNLTKRQQRNIQLVLKKAFQQLAKINA